MVYNAVYFDGKSKFSYVKRFQVLSASRDRLYYLTKENKGSKILYFENRPNGESEIINVFIHSSQKARKKIFEFDFISLDIKGKSAKGNILSKYKIRSVKHKSLGNSTLSGIKVWYDDSIGRLNSDGLGNLIGKFQGEDLMSVFYKDGSYKLLNFDLSNRFDNSEILLITKHKINLPIAAIYYDGKSKKYYVKRFVLETTSVDKKFYYITKEKGSKLEFVTSKSSPIVSYKYYKKKSLVKSSFNLEDFIEVKGWKSLGNKLPYEKIRSGSFKIESFSKNNTSKIIKKSKLKDKKNDKDKNKYQVGDSIELDLNTEQLKMFDE